MGRGWEKEGEGGGGGGGGGGGDWIGASLSDHVGDDQMLLSYRLSNNLSKGLVIWL